MNEIRSASEPRMKKALIYARFSTDLQNERSIEDQITLCRDYASRANIDVIDVYEDRARSGGSIMGRDGLLRLMDRAKDGSFDIVVVEALDRLSRDMEDLAGIHKRLSFLGIEIRAVHEGVVNTVLVGLRGLVGQLYREDIRTRTSNGDHVTCCRVCSGVVRVVLECPPTGRTSRSAFVSVVPRPRKAARAGTQRHSIYTQWKARFLPDWKQRCAIQA